MHKDLDKIRTLIDQGDYVGALDRLGSLGEPGDGGESFADRTVLQLAALNGLGHWAASIELASASLDQVESSGALKQLSTVHGLAGFAYLRKGCVREAEQHLRAAIHILSWNLKDPIAALGEHRRLSLMFKNLGLWHQARFEMD